MPKLREINPVEKLRNLKPGEYFTIRQIAHPKDSQVYNRGEYDRSSRKYSCGRCDDISESREFSGDKTVYTDFVY